MGGKTMLREVEWLCAIGCRGACCGMADFRKLQVWHRSHALTLFIFRITSRRRDPDTRFLVYHLRRAAASIGANIAEGAGQETAAQFCRFLSIAMGSGSEVMNHATLARDLDVLSPAASAHIDAEADGIRAMLSSLRRRKRAVVSKRSAGTRLSPA